MADVDTVHYFGYGSLVNRLTRPPDEDFETATLDGWRRAWAHRVNDPRASSYHASGFTVLSVEPDDKARIDGVLVSMNGLELPALDARERGYSRRSVTLPLSTGSVAIYVSNEAHAYRANSDYPLLQSYVDCVLAGYLALFDWVGVERFMASTFGWTAPMLPDRDDPLYARAVTLSKETADAFDRRIADVRGA